MAGLEVEVHVGAGLTLPGGEQTVGEAVLFALRGEGVERAEVSVAFLSDAAIADLHERFLGQAGPTDVISFPLHEPGGDPVGDVYVGLEQAARQARELGVAPEEEVLRLAIHGTLHVLGYDHPEGEEDRERSPMYGRQEALLRAFLDR